jgi:hypothetical protein
MPTTTTTKSTQGQVRRLRSFAAATSGPSIPSSTSASGGRAEAAGALSPSDRHAAGGPGPAVGLSLSSSVIVLR